MAEATKLDPADRTPSKVLDGVLTAHKDWLSFTGSVAIAVTTTQTTS
ncbi:hypothetical protein [Cupriavidus basilensis]|nr:hypothetical protein [Cupriavidus basilensis]